MKEIVIGRHKVRIYESAEDMPVVRWNKMNKLMMLDSGIGSDMMALEAKVTRIQRLVESGNTEDASVELDNMKSAFRIMNAGVNPRSMAFAVLVHDVDGELCDDMSDEGLNGVIAKLDELTQREARSVTGMVKKKFQEKCRRYFRKVSGSR